MLRDRRLCGLSQLDRVNPLSDPRQASLVRVELDV